MDLDIDNLNPDIRELDYYIRTEFDESWATPYWRR